MAEKIYKIMFDGEKKECIARTNKESGETTFYAKDHRFVVSPKGMDIDEFIEIHNKANGKKPLTPEEDPSGLPDEALESWFDKKVDKKEEE